MPATITLTVGSQSYSVSTSKTNAEVAAMLRDAAERLRADVVLTDNAAVAAWWLHRWQADVREHSWIKRRFDAEVAAADAVPDPGEFT